MAATARKKNAPVEFETQVLKKEIQSTVSAASADDPDQTWTLDSLADHHGATKEAVIDAVRTLLKDADYRKSDPGPAWLNPADYHAVMGGKAELPDMPPVVVHGTLQGFPVTKVRGRIQTFTAIDAALVEAITQVNGRARLIIDVVVAGQSHTPIATKNEGDSTPSFQQTMNLNVVGVRLDG